MAHRAGCAPRTPRFPSRVCVWHIGEVIRTEAPVILVASPTMQCPFFHHTVVVLAANGEEGSFGLVVNKPLDVSFEDVIGEMGLDFEEGYPEDVAVCAAFGLSAIRESNSGFGVFSAPETNVTYAPCVNVAGLTAPAAAPPSPPP